MCQHERKYRYLVDIDNAPGAGRYGGARWCVDETTLSLVEEEWMEGKAKRAAEAWMRAIAPKIEEESARWARDNAPGIDVERYFDEFHPQLLWRFYYHLSELLTDSAKGWETLYHNAKAERDATD